MLRDERDEARRQLQGAEARAEALELKLAELAAELDREQERARDLEARVTRAHEEVAGAVERERRRADARVADLEAQLQAVRRAEEDRRQEHARRERAREVAEQRAREEAETRARRGRQRGARVVPGRPTTLPARIGPGTREEAQALLGPGRLVLLDGYNITLNTQGQLSLEEQRTWLVRLAESAAARLRVRPTVAFDGGGDVPVRPSERSRGVRVLFSPPGVTADDEIVLAVEATDEPVVVVTDDRGLRDRLRPHGVDLLRVDQFLWAVG